MIRTRKGKLRPNDIATIDNREIPIIVWVLIDVSKYDSKAIRLGKRYKRKYSKRA